MSRIGPAVVAVILLALTAWGRAGAQDTVAPAGAAAQQTPAPAGPAPAATPDRAALERDLAAAIAKSASAEEAHVEALYDVARLQALLGRHEQACETLEKLDAAGLFDVGRLRKDDAFAPLRDEERFKKISHAIWLKGYLWLLERPERDAYQMPDKVMQTLALRPGERVADIGAGSGYFTRRVARAVGPGATVWAIDIAPDVLAYLAERARAEGLDNIRTRIVGKEDPEMPAGSVDTVLMVDTLHYIKARADYARRLRAALVPGGRVVIIDFRPKSPEERPWGPPPEQAMSREEVDAAMAEAGLFPARVHDFLPEQFFVEYRVR
jgi:SAM-dependent methyltransferase